MRFFLCLADPRFHLYYLKWIFLPIPLYLEGLTLAISTLFSYDFLLQSQEHEECLPIKVTCGKSNCRQTAVCTKGETAPVVCI